MLITDTSTDYRDFSGIRSPQFRDQFFSSDYYEFRTPREIESDFRLLGIGEKFMGGVIQGFTTINLSRREPANVAEGIAQSFGTWLGITGMFLTGPKGIATRLIAQGGTRGVRAATAMTANQFRSIPIWLGDKTVQGSRSLVKEFGSPAFLKFARKHSFATDAVEGAVRIGTAMGIVNWQEGVEAMAFGAGLGVLFGSTDRMIGNAMRMMRPKLQAALNKGDTASVERVISSISAGIVSGMPSTLMGQPLEYQIYDYLFGAWLGAEPSYTTRTAHQFIHAMRGKGKLYEVFHEKSRVDLPEYQKLMKRHPNQKVRDYINEEINAQFEIHMGQVMGETSMAPVLAALARSAAEAGHLSAEEALAMNQKIYKLIVDGELINESVDKHRQDGLNQGMKEDAAEYYAISKAKDDYALWMMGKGQFDYLKSLADKIEVFTPAKKDYQIYKPVQVGDEIGIVMKISDQGDVLQVTAADGIDLIRPVTKGSDVVGEVQTPKQISEARAKADSASGISRAELVKKIREWRYQVDSEGVFTNQGDDAIPLDVPEGVWDIYPDLGEYYRRPSFFIGNDGKYYPEWKVSGKSVYRSKLGFETEAQAYTHALYELAGINKQIALSRDPYAYADMSVLMQLADAYNSMDYDIKVRPILQLVTDIITDLSATGKIETRADIYTNPIKTYKTIFEIFQSTKDRNQQIMDLTRELRKAQLDQGEGASARVEAIQQRIADLKTQYGKYQGWDSFLSRMARQYPMKDDGYWTMKNPKIRELRQWYKGMERRELIKKASILESTLQMGEHQTVKTHRMDFLDVFPNNERVSTLRSPSYLQRVLRKLNPEYDLIQIGKIYSYQDRQVYELLDRNLTAEQYNSMLSRLYEEGKTGHRYFIASGLKDKDTLRAIPYMFNNVGDAKAYLLPRIEAMRKHKGYEKFMDSNYKILLRKNIGINNHDAIMQQATMMRLWEAVNNDVTGSRSNADGSPVYRYPVEFLANTDGFIKTVANMNKRLQILESEGVLLDPHFYKHEDGSQMAGLRFIVVNATNKSGLPQVEGTQPFLTPDQARRAEEHLDGPVILSRNVFAQMKEDGGLDPRSGAIKGVTMFADAHGGFMGKYAMFEASVSQDAYMKANNLDAMYYDTTTKQLGNRRSVDLSINKNGEVILLDANNQVISQPEQVSYLAPFDGVTLNIGQSENLASNMKSKRLPVQLLQTFSPHLMDRNVARQTINEIMNSGDMTTPEVAGFIKELQLLDMAEFDRAVYQKKLNELKKRVPDIDIDDISTADLFDLLKGEGLVTESGLYDHIVRQIHSRKSEIISESAELGQDTTDALVMTSDSHTSMLDVLLDVTAMSDQMITPELIGNRGLRDYVNAVYRNFIVNRTLRPKMKYSLKSIASHQDAWFLHENLPVREGEFMLGQAAKGMKIRVGERDMRLGDAWEQYSVDLPKKIRATRSAITSMQAALKSLDSKSSAHQKLAEDITRLKRDETEYQMQLDSLDSAMDMVVSRVPIEHASGVRALKFRGFSDEQGVTGKFSPDDMRYLGGMDLDIDSVFIFQNMGKTKYKAADGSMKSAIDYLRDPSISRHWNNADGSFRDPKSPEMQNQWGAKYDKSRNYEDMFNPDKLIEAGRGTALANSSLGMIVNARRDILAMLDSFPREVFAIKDMQITGRQKKVLENVFGKDVQFIFKARKDAHKIIDEIARAGINMSADAADLVGFMPKFDIKGMMHSKAFELSFANLKGKIDKRTIAYKKAIDILSKNSPVMKTLQGANRALDGGYAKETNMDSRSMVSVLRMFNQKLIDAGARAKNPNQGFASLHGSYFHAVNSLQKIDNSYDPLSGWSKTNLDQFYSSAEVFFNSGKKVVKNYKDLFTKLTGRSRGVYREAYDKFVQHYNTLARQFQNGQSNDIVALKEAYDGLAEMISNDVNDLASVMMLYKEAHHLLESGASDMQTLSHIFEMASNAKRNLYQIKNPDKKNTEAGRMNHHSEEGVVSAWQQYVTKAVPPHLRKYADYAIMSTLFKPVGPKPDPSKMDKATYIAEMIKWNKHSLWTNHLHQSAFMREVVPENMADYFRIYNFVANIGKQVPKQLEGRLPKSKKYPEGREIYTLETFFQKVFQDIEAGIDPFLFPYDYYRRPMPKRLDYTIKNLASNLAPNEGKVESISQEGASSDVAKYLTIQGQQMDIIKSLGKYMDGGGEVSFNAEQRYIFTQLRDLMIKHPQIRDQLDLLIIGEASVTRRMSDSGQLADRLDKLTMDDLRMFLAAAKGHIHGDLLSDPKIHSWIPRWWYWMVPEKYHRNFAPLDLKIDTVVARTRSGETVQGKIFSSPAKQLVAAANAIQLATEIKSYNLSHEVAEILQPWASILDKDFHTVFEYTVMDRIMKHGDPSDYVKASHKAYKEKIEQLHKTKMFWKLDDKRVMVDDAVQGISEGLTLVNQKVWGQIVHNRQMPRYNYEGTDRWVNKNAIVNRIIESMKTGNIDALWTPDMYTLNNIVMQDYIHKAMTAEILKAGGEVPEIGTAAWIRNADALVKANDMDASIDMPSLPFDSYYPYRNHSKAALRKWAIKEKDYKKALEADTIIDDAVFGMRLYQDADLMDRVREDHSMAEIIGLRKRAKDYDFGKLSRNSHLKKRSEVNKQIPDWDPGIVSYFEYINTMVKSQHNKAYAIGAAEIIKRFETSAAGKGNIKHYGDFLRMYVSDQVMTQTMIPQSWVDNYAALNLKGSGYYYFTDRYYTNLDKAISQILKTKPLLADNNPGRGLRLAEIANMEAKFSLLTLLSRPKAAFTNLYGGQTILASDVGLSYALKGHRLKEIQKVFPEFKDWNDAMKFANDNGAMESLVTHEGLPDAVKVQVNKAFGQIKQAIKNDPGIRDLQLRELLKAKGFNDKVVQIAAIPMRYSERILRSRSFYAHYLRAMDVMGINPHTGGAHPWALAMARRGVATTQFMYNNANRPAFARSNVGKIWSRFKLWAINSVKFRADMYNEYMSDLAMNVQHPGTQQRLNNIIMMDMFMIALAGLFPFSVMGSSIPEPYAWMNELVAWAFGDEKEKAQSFRGGGGLPQFAVPFNVLAPPSSRLATAWIDPLVRDDWNLFANYTIWTMFPFGLLARDTRNAIRRPSHAIDRLTGLPVGEVATSVQKKLPSVEPMFENMNIIPMVD